MAVIYCNSFGLELLQGTHNFASHTFKFALFTLALLGVAAWREGRPEQSSR